MGLKLLGTTPNRSGKRPPRGADQMKTEDFLKHEINRRQFLGSSAKNAAGMAAGMVGLAGAVAQASPGERVRIAAIGVRSQGKSLALSMAGFADVDVVAGSEPLGNLVTW